jgi:tape measure domain-containing protein
MSKFAANTAKASQQSAASLKGIGNAVDHIGPALRNMGGMFAAAFSTNAIIGLADEFTRFQSKLINAKVAASDMARVQKELFATARANGQEVTSLADLYGNMAMSAKSLGLNQTQMMQATQGVAAAMKLSGSTTAQSSATILQLGQALAGGTVRAEEYNSMLENAPALVRAVAESSTKWKGDLGALRKEINDGTVSSKEWASAIIAASASLKADAANAPLTVASAMQNLRTSLVEYIGQADQSLGASEKLGFALKLLGENIDLVAKSLLLVVAVLASRATGAMVTWAATQGASAVASARLTMFQTAMTASMTGVSRGALLASSAMTKLNASMAFFGGPLGLAITAIASAVLYLGTMSRNAAEDLKEFEENQRRTNEVLAQADDILRKSAKGTKDVGDNSAGAVGGVMALCDATRALADETYRLADAQAQAARMAIFKQVETNRERINQLSNPSVGRQIMYGMENVGSAFGGQRDFQNADNAERDQLIKDNAALMGRAIQLVTAPGARLIQGSPSTSGGGGAGGRGSVKSRGGGTSAEERADNDERLLTDARRRNIDALNALAETSDQRHGNALFMIDLEALEIEKAIKKQQADGKVSEAAVTEALSINENTRLEERRAEEKRYALEVEQERADIARDALEMEQSINDLNQTILRDRAGMAKTTSERVALENAQFALYQQAAKADFEARQAETRARLKNANRLDAEAERGLASEAAAFAQMQETETQRRAYDERKNNPFAKYVDQAADMRSSLQSVAADGLGALEDGILDVLDRNAELKDSFRDVANSVISDLKRIAIQKMIIAPLANMLGFGSGANIFSMFSGMGSGSSAIPGDNGGLLPGALNRSARGTTFSPGGLTLLNEGGPELVNLPRGSQVLPSGDVRNLLSVPRSAGSRAPVFHFTTNVQATGAVMVAEIEKKIETANYGAVQAARALVAQDMAEQGRSLRR